MNRLNIELPRGLRIQITDNTNLDYAVGTNATVQFDTRDPLPIVLVDGDTFNCCLPMSQCRINVNTSNQSSSDRVWNFVAGKLTETTIDRMHKWYQTNDRVKLNRPNELLDLLDSNVTTLDQVSTFPKFKHILAFYRLTSLDDIDELGLTELMCLVVPGVGKKTTKCFREVLKSLDTHILSTPEEMALRNK